jgi:hypothetical protein
MTLWCCTRFGSRPPNTLAAAPDGAGEPCLRDGRLANAALTAKLEISSRLNLLRASTTYHNVIDPRFNSSQE